MCSLYTISFLNLSKVLLSYLQYRDHCLSLWFFSLPLIYCLSPYHHEKSLVCCFISARKCQAAASQLHILSLSDTQIYTIAHNSSLLIYPIYNGSSMMGVRTCCLKTKHLGNWENSKCRKISLSFSHHSPMTKNYPTFLA